jgi:hypothetical protein
VVRQIAARYGWTLQQMGELTYYQAMVMAGAICPEDGRIRLTPDQSRHWDNHRGI